MGARHQTGARQRLLLISRSEDETRPLARELSALGDDRFSIESCSAEHAAERIAERPFDVVLVNAARPRRMLEAVEEIVPIAGEAAVLAVTERDDPRCDRAALRIGAQDVLRGNELDDGGLARAVRKAVERHRRVLSLQEATQRAQHEAAHDPLTGLPNRACFQTQLDEAVHFARRYGQRLALLFVDLDRFKRVNDELGHAAGDRLLIEVATRLRNCLRKSDLAARLSGDEFAVLLKNLSAAEDAEIVAGCLIEALAEPVRLEGVPWKPSGSVGIALLPEDSRSAERLLRAADAAMYAAKADGRGCFRRHRRPSRQKVTPARISATAR